jgi:DNA-binding SARP family transcriptional activator
MIDFRLLGPLEASADGAPLALPAGKPRALLARLVLDAGHVVAVETLVESLWERPPASAYKVLQVYVSQLRKALGSAAIETRRPGYRLGIGRDDSDLGRFEALAEAARAADDPARRSDLLGRALSLWRGPALAEFRDEPFARAAGRRLAELRLATLEQRIEADLDLGRHELLVGELEALVEEEPLREQPRRQLMLALYRAGRQAEALGHYRDARRVLVDELGIDPSPRLQELERAILRHDAALHEEEDRSRHARGCVICSGSHLVELVAPLCADGRELLVVEIAADAGDLSERAARLERLRRSMPVQGIEVRIACFTSAAPGDDLARLAAEQQAELVVVGEHEAGGTLVAGAACDVALAPRPDLRFEPDGAVLVPFGGGREEWAALEVGAWLARAHGLPLRLLGTEGAKGGRDASRMLANASLALQRFAGTAAEPAIVPRGPDGILAERGALLVASLPADGLDGTRRTLVERSSVPLLFVRGGLRPGGLAPERTLTRFSWSLRERLS